MKKNLGYALALVHVIVLLDACNNGPKTIPATPTDDPSNSSTGVFSDGGGTPQQGAPALEPGIEKDLHTVVAEEVLPTTKYVYVKVKEGGEEFWVAAMKQEVVIGRTYFYRGGLLKTDFPSKEYNRTFDKLYLISQLVPADHGSAGTGMNAAPQFTPPEGTPEIKVSDASSMRIADLVANPKKYVGKAVQLRGKVSKVNLNIMGRNWIHLKDGSKDDYDLVITTGVPVEEGQKVTVVGTVALDKDFGSGYKYDILLEGGVLVK